MFITQEPKRFYNTSRILDYSLHMRFGSKYILLYGVHYSKITNHVKGFLKTKTLPTKVSLKWRPRILILSFSSEKLNYFIHKY